jgi:thiosulfate/3-mercaptopyruvate sulfurtransferase
MIYSTLISVPELIPNIGDPNWVIIDCRFSLEDPESGRQGYLDAHIPGALYAHLDEDLCGPVIKGQTGRHPLPSIESFTEKLGDWGINSSVKVVAYDDAGGAMAASRLWWLLRWLGHYAVAVLDGGWREWLSSGQPVRSGVDPGLLIVDSRAEERYRGEVEPIDPVAGHIPGAINAPHQNVLNEHNRFLEPEKLQAYFTKLLGDFSTKETVFYCGSGVTAVQNVLALAHAGLGDARLYAGSWSEWITDPARPIATGIESK